ncbi:MAG: Asp-tRNA(Asn)/Glu-tRNA(Gln) amidotransferase subunit GatB [Patescibacteria group bacterium]
MYSNNFKPIIGLEVHVELATNSKMFCSCPADPFDKQPNSQVCPVCLGLPGALPVANKTAIDSVVKFGLALNCQIAKFSKFDRKHYFYPDLPKSYQISQYDLPFCSIGFWKAKDGKQINIRRIHLEEDTAKLSHETINDRKVSLVDFNRSSVPLMEMVTEPDFYDADDVVAFLKEIQRIVRYLGISKADMEKGSMRLEANISMAKTQDTWPPQVLPEYKVELKNINSFRFLKKALEAEFVRQSLALEAGEKLVQETRGYDEVKDRTFSQRVKEEAQDYRYFPEPDLPPVTITDSEIADIKAQIPELPEQKREKYRTWQLPNNYIEFLIDDKITADYFEKAVEIGKQKNITEKQIASLMVNQRLHEQLSDPEQLVKRMVESENKTFASEEELTQAINQVIAENQKAVSQFKEGKTEVVGFLIGQVQKILKGTGNPKDINSNLMAELTKK